VLQITSQHDWLHDYTLNGFSQVNSNGHQWTVKSKKKWTIEKHTTYDWIIETC
jgi:hypothetical protein